jgi:tetratricopeptide (TPR) repeat protein
MLRWCFALLLCLIFSLQGASQYYVKEKELIKKIEQAQNDSVKIIALSNLADFYYIYRAAHKGDSILNRQLSLAEFSSNRNLLLIALFGNGVSNVTEWTSSENFDRSLAFLDKGLNYAREIGRDDYQALAYMRKAFIYRKRGQYDNATNEVNLALSTALRLNDDSLKAAIELETGDISLGKGKTVDAYKHYNQAFDIAYTLKNISLQSDAYHRFAALYQSLSDKDLAKDNLLKSLQLNLANNNKKGVLQDYIDLARLTDNREYFDKILSMSEELNDEKNKIRAKRLMFSYLMTVEKNCNNTMAYFKSNADLQQSYINWGNSMFYWNIGNIYKYCGKNDSALFFFKLAEPDIQKNFDPAIQKSVYSNMAECYTSLGEATLAIGAYEKALNLARQQNDLQGVASFTLQLSKLEAGAGNFKNAYKYQSEHLLSADSLQDLMKKRDLVLLEVDRENKKHEKDLQEIAVKASRLRNLQYMGISAAIATFFIFLMLLGMFPISKVTIKMLSFFAFISLFEFIVLLIDSILHRLTHGEPLKIWLIKIFLIALLVPIQHFLEHGMVRFLASQRLLRMREQLSFRRILTGIKKPAAKEEVGLEEDTAVL